MIGFSLLLAIVVVVVVAIAIVVTTTTTANPGLTTGIVRERGDDGVGIVDSQTTRVFHLLKLGHLPWFVHVRDRDVSQFGDPQMYVFPVLIVISTLLDNVETIDTSTGQSSRGAPILTRTHTQGMGFPTKRIASAGMDQSEKIGRQTNFGGNECMCTFMCTNKHTHTQTNTNCDRRNVPPNWNRHRNQSDYFRTNLHRTANPIVSPTPKRTRHFVDPDST